MPRFAATLGAALSLTACATTAPFEDPGQVRSQPTAESATEQFSGVDVNATAACVRENATEGELALMALGGTEAQGATARVLGRPETQSCLAENNVILPSVPG